MSNTRITYLYLAARATLVSLTWSSTPHPPAACFGYSRSRLEKPAGLTPKKRPCSSAHVVPAQAGSFLLPHMPIYVGSLGPFYHELGPTISPQPQTDTMAARTITVEKKNWRRWPDSHRLLWDLPSHASKTLASPP